MQRSQVTTLESFQRVTVGLGSFVAIQGQADLDRTAQVRALDAACDALRTVETAMHPTTAGSDLARIAAAPGGTLLPIHPWTFAVLALSQRLWKMSEGHFDPCIPSSPASVGDLQLVAPASVRTAQVPALLDLGGIAKGFAIDRAVDALIEHGCSAGLVNAGGDLRAFGPLTNCALAVSAPKSARSPPEHRGFYSRVAGAELAGRLVGVSAPTAAAADALTKCALACPPAVLRRLLEEFSASELTLD
ncbi:MAG TPA: FAD:protein FMN transferase [Steroidobacteraceae bacterium]